MIANIINLLLMVSYVYGGKHDGHYIGRDASGSIITSNDTTDFENDYFINENITITGFVENYTVSSTYNWGIDRIDQNDLPLDNSVLNLNNCGNGVHVYVLDTGVDSSHPEFTNRVLPGINIITPGAPTNDVHGHGTHVSSTIIGNSVGIARCAKVIPVKVLSDSGSGSIAGVIEGIEKSVQHHIDNRFENSIISMSLGGGYNKLLNEAVDNAVDMGVPVVVAAGNEYSDACLYSPASAEKAITVGATTQYDSIPSFSNDGECVSILAPGSFIVGARTGGGYRSMSGTSMAAPHVSGVLAVYLNLNDGDISGFIEQSSVENKISNVPSSTDNLLLNVVKYDSIPDTPNPCEYPESGWKRRKRRRWCKRNKLCKWSRNTKECLLK